MPKKRLARFSLWGIVLMIVAIVAGQWIGTMLIPYLGNLGAGIIGSLVVGLVTYVIYALITGSKLGIVPAVVFAILVYIANIVAGYIASMLGLGGGILTLVITGTVAALLWGYVGVGKGKKVTAAPRL